MHQRAAQVAQDEVSGNFQFRVFISHINSRTQFNPSTFISVLLPPFFSFTTLTFRSCRCYGVQYFIRDVNNEVIIDCHF